MYGWSGLIQWMDIQSGKVEISSMEVLFQQYAERLSKPVNDISSAEFGGNNVVKVKEGDGWTDILKIEKREYTGNSDVYKILLHGKVLYIDEYGWIPIFDGEHPQKGFHGELIYPRVMRAPKDIVAGKDKMRIKAVRDANGIIEFSTIKSIEKAEYKHPYLYFIYTKSRYININGIYTFADDSFTTDEIDVENFVISPLMKTFTESKNPMATKHWSPSKERKI